MIVLDTNVPSELMRLEPNPAVVAWVSSQPRANLYTSSLSEAEILYGIAMLPKGRRRSNLAAAAEVMFASDLAGRVLPFDGVAAAHYAAVVDARRQSGSSIDAFDALIAATALAAGAEGVATRDVSGFEGCGLARVVNPWVAQRNV
jgi:toxin FitB